MRHATLADRWLEYSASIKVPPDNDVVRFMFYAGALALATQQMAAAARSGDYALTSPAIESLSLEVTDWLDAFRRRHDPAA